MFYIQNYGSFIMAVVVFQIIPGAGTVTILNATARQGVGSGMKAVLGTLSGDFIYMLAAVLGLAAILSAHPGVLNSAQWLGAVYLGWIGWKLLRTPLSGNPVDPSPREGNWAYFLQAFAVSLTNPKVKKQFHILLAFWLVTAVTPAGTYLDMLRRMCLGDEPKSRAILCNYLLP